MTNAMNAIFWVALVLAAISWLIFFDQLYRITGKPSISATASSGELRREGLDAASLLTAAGNVAAAFGKVGAGPTAATLSALYMIVALVAASLGKL